MSKEVIGDLDTQVLTVIRLFKLSPFYLYNWHPVLYIEIILKTRRKCLGEKPDKLSIEQQYKPFVLVHQKARMR